LISHYFSGDKEVVAAMKEFGDYTDQAKLVFCRDTRIDIKKLFLVYTLHEVNRERIIAQGPVVLQSMY
jgi:hypothetical protein